MMSLLYDPLTCCITLVSFSKHWDHSKTIFKPVFYIQALFSVNSILSQDDLLMIIINDNICVIH